MDNVTFSIQKKSGNINFSIKNIPYLKEDESFLFSIKAPVSYGEPILSLQDFQIEKINKTENRELAEYKSNIGKHFLNFFGRSEIFLSFQNFDIEEGFIVEILATKITAEQAKKILDYLSYKMSDILKVCFSKSRGSVSFNQVSEQDISIMLHHAENGLKLLSRHRNQFKQKKITILKPKLELQSKRQINNITNSTIFWIFNNLDKIYPVDSGGIGLLKTNGRNYDVDFIETEVLQENTNIYENQLILSYLHDIKDFLYVLKVRLNNKSINIEIEKNYFRFEDVLSEIKEKLFLKPRLQQCDKLLKECNQLILFMNIHLPCTLIKGMRVKITPSVKVNQHYKQLFLYIYEWQNFTEPNWQGEDYLYGLRTLWKLYEFFCLYELIEGINKSRFSLEKVENRKYSREHGFSGKLFEDENNPANFYVFRQGAIKIELFYEPNIWTYTGEHTKDGDLVDVLHNGTGRRSRYSPDFVLKVFNANECFLLIFDAKYSKRSTVQERHLPELIKKYLYGIHIMKSGSMESQAPVKLLYALHPTLTNEYIESHYNFYNKNHGLFSKFPINPAVGAIALNPDKNSIIDEVLSKFFKIS